MNEICDVQWKTFHELGDSLMNSWVSSLLYIFVIERFIGVKKATLEGFRVNMDSSIHFCVVENITEETLPIYHSSWVIKLSLELFPLNET